MSLVRLYHGTSERAWRSIQRDRELRAIDFGSVAKDVARAMKVNAQDLWNSPFYEFERGRKTWDPSSVYLSVRRDTAAAYKSSESYIDAVRAARHLRGESIDDRSVATDVEKILGKPVLLLLDMPWNTISEIANPNGLEKERWLRAKRIGGSGTVILPSPIDAKFVVHSVTR